MDSDDGDLKGEFDSPEEFAKKIEGIINNPDAVKEFENGRKVWWDDESGIIVIHNPSDPDGGTAFKPEDGKEYFDRQ